MGCHRERGSRATRAARARPRPTRPPPPRRVAILAGPLDHLLHFLSRSEAPLQALVLQNLDCTTAAAGRVRRVVRGVARGACAGRRVRLTRARCAGSGRAWAGARSSRLLSVVDCPGVTKGWCDGMQKVMMRRGVETNIRMSEPKTMNKAPGMW